MRQHPEAEESNDGGGGAAAEVAVAAAGGSASATALRTGGGRASGANGQTAAAVGRDDDEDRHRGPGGAPRVPWVQLPFAELPELPEQEVRAVLAERAERAGLAADHCPRADAQLRQIGGGPQQEDLPGQGVEESAAQHRSATPPRMGQEAREGVPGHRRRQRTGHRNRGIGQFDQGGPSPRLGVKRAAPLLAQPAAKSRRVVAPHLGATTTELDAGRGFEVNQRGPVTDEFDEDPFGHIAEEMAAQQQAAESRGGRWSGSTEPVRRAAPKAGPGAPETDCGGPEEPLDEDSAEAPEAQGLHPASAHDGVPPRGGEQRGGEQGMVEQEQLSSGTRKRPRCEGRAGGLHPQDGPEGKRARSASEAGAAQEEGSRPFGRRYLGVHRDPVDAADDRGHHLRVTGPVVWCDRCARYASRRLGRALKAACSGEAKGAYSTRLLRLRAGRHPLTGDLLVEGG